MMFGFGLFRRNPVEKARQEYERKLREARDLQRGGDVVAAAQAHSDADSLLRELEALEARAGKEAK